MKGDRLVSKTTEYYTQGGARLYSVSELAELTGNPPVYIRKWFANGGLKYFFTAYRVFKSNPTRLFFKPGPPEEGDKLVEGSDYIYEYRKWTGGAICESQNQLQRETQLQPSVSVGEN